MVSDNAKKLQMTDEEKELNEKMRETAAKALSHYTDGHDWYSFVQK